LDLQPVARNSKAIAMLHGQQHGVPRPIFAQSGLAARRDARQMTSTGGPPSGVVTFPNRYLLRPPAQRATSGLGNTLAVETSYEQRL